MNESQLVGRSGKRKFYQDDRKINPYQQITKQRTVANIIRISTPQDHVECLREGISRATKSILITSYGVDHDMLATYHLYPLFTYAKQRGVNIYIYNSDTKDTDCQASNFFRRHNIAYDGTFTHAKIFAVDNTVVTIGSYNWLSKDNLWENASLRFSGSECAELIPLVWEDLKYFRNLQFGNFRQLEQYDLDHEDTVPEKWKLDNTTELHYINCLEAHRQFIDSIFKNAKRKIILCSPFINSDSGYQKDFTKKLLNQTLSRKVRIFFVCRTNDPNLSDFRVYLGNLLYSPFMHLVTMLDIHLKTVIVDDEMIAEGSFNWLSASREEDSPYHNHEVTLMLSGNGSRDSIKNFYDSDVGREFDRLAGSRFNGYTEREDSYFSDDENSNDNSNSNSNSYHSNSLTDNDRWWLSLHWRISRNGNTCLNFPRRNNNQGTHSIVIIQNDRENSFSAIVDNLQLDGWFDSEDDAKLAAGNYLGLL